MPDDGNSAPPEGTVLGFDFGLSRTGVAVGETLTGSARPLRTLACRDGQPNWDEVAQLIAEWQPVALVVGVPRHADGTLPAAGEGAERFARRLHGRFRLPVHTVDERLSSYVAEQALAHRGVRGQRLRKQKAALDSMAACVILDTWFTEHGR